MKGGNVLFLVGNRCYKGVIRGYSGGMCLVTCLPFRLGCGFV